ncbi:MAG: inositol monophosphatase [Alphaproteobacteria bacterium]|nr:inositol monophosphatase [Alphaproteobacteria bacterium]
MVMRPALINVMANAAQKAGRALVRDFGEVEHLQISRKGPADFVSAADLKSQKILREELSKARPSFGFYMEEDDGGPNFSTQEERWIVDPLDGTTNFLHSMPHWCISIAAMRGAEVVAGMIYDPLADKMFWAEKGIGAYCNNKRMRVATRQNLADSLVGICLPRKGMEQTMPQALKTLETLLPLVAGVRSAGSAALALAYVAAGRYDACVEVPWLMALKLYDVAAGVLLVKEAGGFVSSLDTQEKDPLASLSFVAGTGAIHDQLVRLLRV